MTRFIISTTATAVAIGLLVGLTTAADTEKPTEPAARSAPTRPPKRAAIEPSELIPVKVNSRLALAMADRDAALAEWRKLQKQHEFSGNDSDLPAVLVQARNKYFDSRSRIEALLKAADIVESERGKLDQPQPPKKAPSQFDKDVPGDLIQPTGKLRFGVGVNSDAGVTSPVVMDELDFDLYVLDRLKKTGFPPADDGDPRKMIRRWFIDLTGVLPTEKQTQAVLSVFEDLSRQNADEKLRRRKPDTADVIAEVKKLDDYVSALVGLPQRSKQHKLIKAHESLETASCLACHKFPAAQHKLTETHERPQISITERKTKLTLVENSTKVLWFKNRVRSVDGFDTQVIKAAAVDDDPHKIMVQAVADGLTSVSFVDEKSGIYTVDIVVVGDTRQLQHYIERLYPDASVQAIQLGDGVVLRGAVSQPQHVEELVEVAEQFYPRVINHVRVADTGSRRSAVSRNMPAGMRLVTIEQPLETGRLLRKGDLVDLVFTGGRPLATSVLLRAVQVYSADPKTGRPNDPDVSRVWLILSPQDAEKLSKAESEGKISLTLRARPAAAAYPSYSPAANSMASGHDVFEFHIGFDREAPPDRMQTLSKRYQHLKQARESLKSAGLEHLDKQLAKEMHVLLEEMKALERLEMQRRSATQAATPSTQAVPLTPLHREVRGLRQDVRQLRNDVNRLRELLEKRTSPPANPDDDQAAALPALEIKNGLLVFHAPWSAPCRKMLDMIDQYREDGHAIRLIDIDRQPDFVKRFEITLVPTLITLDHGKVQHRYTGVQSPEELELLLESVPIGDPVRTGDGAADEDEATAQPTSKIQHGLLVFHSPRSAAGREMIDMLDESREAGYAAIRMIDIDRHPELVKQFSVTFVPTLILLDYGKVQQRYTGVQSEAQLEALMESIPIGDPVRTTSDEPPDVAVSPADDGPKTEEERIEQALDRKVSLKLERVPLSDFLKEVFSRTEDLNIVIDGRKSDGTTIDTNTPISVEVEDVTLRSALKSALDTLGLTFTVKNEVLKITPK